MSRRSWVILAATAFLIVVLVVLLLVPTPPERAELIEEAISHCRGALAILVPASWHTLTVDRKKAVMEERSSHAPPAD